VKKAKAKRSHGAPERETRPDERILQLLLMLIGAGRPVSRAEIFEAIAGYRTRLPAAGERKFERDKKDLLELGVPIDVPEDEPNTYQVQRRAYELPELTLEDDERAALALAAEALASWDGLPYRDLVEDALRKLSFWDALPAPTRPPGHMAVALPSRSRARGPRKMVAALTQAVELRKRVTLRYRPNDDEPTERVVDPYALVYSGGDWLLIGHCHLRSAPRTFRVDRVERLKVAGKPGTPDFERPPGWDLSTYVQRSPWVFQAGASGGFDVVLDVGPERSWVADEDFGPGATLEALPAGVGGESWTRVSFRSGNPDYIVTRALDAAGHLRVVAPEELRERVRATAASVGALYGATSPEAKS
jgi:proteasome accessory factor B